MKPTKKLVAIAGMSAAVAVGGAAGAMLGVPGVSSAQTGDAATDDTEDPGEGFERGPRHGFGHHRALHGLEAAAEALGMETTDLAEALRDGKTIAEVAQEQGVDVTTVIDALVADANERLDEAVADGKITEERAAEIRANLEDRITEMVNNGRPEGPGHDRRGMPGLETAAEVIGIDAADLAEALRDGKTVAEVAQENGVEPEAVIDALVADAEERITDFVNNGPQRPGDDGDDGDDEVDDTEGASTS